MWAARKPISGKRLPLAAENRVDRLDQALDRNLVRIVVAADEAVLGKPGPLGRGCGQPGGSSRAKSNVS